MKQYNYLYFIILSIFTTNYCSQQEISSLIFTSQNGQDKYILENFFKNEDGTYIKDGFFIEFGAFDGIEFSNTKVLEQLGWKGICIEPIPEAFAKLQKNRSCICIEGCISDKEGTALFRQVCNSCEVLSGLAEKYEPQHNAIVENYYRAPSIYYEVHCYRLSQILHDYNIKKIDFLSIDTEGGELDILQSLSQEDLARIDVICVENNYENPKFIEFLESKNFKFICRMQQDLIFRNKRYL